MLFNSVQFLFFFPLVALLYLHVPLRERRQILLLSSFYFYSVFSVKLSLLLLWSTLLDYSLARVIDGSTRPAVRKAALTASVVGNLSVLGVFKYLDFFNETIAVGLGHNPWPVLNLILPMGISFYTFQTMSYTIDVYSGKLGASKSLMDVALYVSFFPQLVAGPIMRGATLLPQFREEHRPEERRILSGALLCLWGLCKKVFIADPMGTVVDSVYAGFGQAGGGNGFSGAACLIATYAFAVQIYCDFSAYSDIAIGAGRVLGFRLMRNFDAPYTAISVRQFWRRWHISLSTWLRDYLYIPLGGNRGGRLRTGLALIATMLLGGLWHGASSTFVVWGALHGAYLLVERLAGQHRVMEQSMGFTERSLRRVVTLHLVLFAWIFFRAPSMGAAFDILGRILTWSEGRGIGPAPLIVLAAIVAFQLVGVRRWAHDLLLRHRRPAMSLAYGCYVALLVLLNATSATRFIYFQF